MSPMQVRLTREYVHIEAPKGAAGDTTQWVEGGTENYDEPESVSDDNPPPGPPEPPPPPVFFPIGTLGTIKGFTPRTRRGESSRVLVAMTGIRAGANGEGIEPVEATVPIRVAHVALVEGNGHLPVAHVLPVAVDLPTGAPMAEPEAPAAPEPPAARRRPGRPRRG